MIYIQDSLLFDIVILFQLKQKIETQKKKTEQKILEDYSKKVVETVSAKKKNDPITDKENQEKREKYLLQKIENLEHQNKEITMLNIQLQKVVIGKFKFFGLLYFYNIIPFDF